MRMIRTDAKKASFKFLKQALLGCLSFGFVQIAHADEKIIFRAVNGVVIDAKRLLMWEDSYSSGNVATDLNGAIEYCKNSRWAGYDDWRLPKLDEIKYIFIKGSGNNNHVIEFGNSRDSGYLTSTPDGAERIMVLGFHNGDTFNPFRWNTNHYVRCVRKLIPGEKYPTPPEPAER